ncbi:uncharacterized protein LOC124940049 [Impatiens glandulifera]|uniref:uncharacterized protein LOC124940049 n=1 Tax=Impatiens glandulifera TaxID=253017 RepID=UPI001FB178CE|nr:uncharacterized protein LOC124940049 [Impatiens glandulifera]
MARSIDKDNSPSLRPGDAASTSSSNPVRVRARPDPFLVVCRCFSVVTAIAAVLCVVVNVLSAVRSFKNGSDIFDGIFRCYAVVVAIFAVVAETEWGFIMKFCKVLEYWAARGMLLIFVAVMTRAYPEDNADRKDLVLLQNIACFMLLSCGVIYVVSGVLCIGHLKRLRQKKEVSKDQAVKDLQELERRREELEALLLVEERV